MSAPYRICPDCGAHLDHGEPCDCKESKTDREAGEEAGQQATRNQREPVLAPGA